MKLTTNFFSGHLRIESFFCGETINTHNYYVKDRFQMNEIEI